MVCAVGFEPTSSAPQTPRITALRHTEIFSRQRIAAASDSVRNFAPRSNTLHQKPQGHSNMAPPPGIPGEGTDTRTGCAAGSRVETNERQSSKAARTAGDDCISSLNRSELLKSGPRSRWRRRCFSNAVLRKFTCGSLSAALLRVGCREKPEKENKKPGVFRHPGSRWCCLVESGR